MRLRSALTAGGLATLIVFAAAAPDAGATTTSAPVPVTVTLHSPNPQVGSDDGNQFGWSGVLASNGDIYYASQSPDGISKFVPSTGAVTFIPLPTTANGESPDQIVVGPDGNLWFTMYNHGTGNGFGQLTVATDTITTFHTSGVTDGVVSSGGFLWFLSSDFNTAHGVLFKVNPNTGAVVATYSETSHHTDYALAADSTSKLWIQSDEGGWLSFDPSTATFGPLVVSGVSGRSIVDSSAGAAMGADGHTVYFDNPNGDNGLYAFNTATGTTTEIIAGNVQRVTVGPDGRVYADLVDFTANTNTIEVYDPTTDVLSPHPVAAGLHEYSFGGSTGTGAIQGLVAVGGNLYGIEDFGTGGAYSIDDVLAPTLPNLSATLPQDTTRTVDELVGVSGVGATTVTIATAPAHGTVAVDPVTGAITYTPAVVYTGPDVLTYRACLVVAASVCSTATITFTVTPVATTSATVTPSTTSAAPATSAAVSSTVQADELAATGNPTGLELTVGGALIALGWILIVASRRQPDAA